MAFHTRLRTGMLFACLLMLSAAPGCDDDAIEGSGILLTQEYPITDFTGILAESGFDVTVAPDSMYSVEVTTDDNLSDDVEVYRSGAALVLKPKPDRDVHRNFMRADVRMPLLSSLILSAGAECDIREGFDSNEPFSVTLSAGASAEGAMRSGPLSCVLSGGSNLVLSGAGGTGSLVASGGSSIDLREYPLTDVTISAEGGSVIYVQLDGRLDVTASGGSRVYYRGDPQLGAVSITGGSTLQQLP